MSVWPTSRARAYETWVMTDSPRIVLAVVVGFNPSCIDSARAIRDGEAKRARTHGDTPRSSRERACSVTVPSRPISAHSCERVRGMVARAGAGDEHARVRRVTGSSSATLLMARKAPSYTNFSHELCYFEHERGANVSSANSARLGTEMPIAKKRNQRGNPQITRPRLPSW